MIAIQIASNTEWQSICELYGVKQTHATPYGPYFDVEIQNEKCRLYFSGYSKTKAAGAAQYAISTWAPRHIYVCGTCGGVSGSLHPEDIIIASETVFYDCIDRFTVSDAPFFPYLDSKLDVKRLDFMKAFGIKFGRIATGDQDIDLLIRQSLEPLGVLAADWESAAVSHICSLNNTPLTVIRGVTDIPGYNGASMKEQADSYYALTPRIMDQILNTILPELIKNTF